MSVDGDWKITIQSPMGPQAADLSVTSSGETFTGKVDGELSGAQDISGTVEGERLRFNLDITQPMALKLEFDVAVSGDTLDGTVKLGMFGNSKVSGARA